MESIRLVSLVIFCVTLFILGERWVDQYGKKDVPPSSSKIESTVNDVPTSTSIVAGKETPRAAAPVATAPQQAVPVSAGGEVLVLQTDVMKVHVSTVGGDIQRVELLDQKDTLDPTKNFVLLETGGKRTYLAQSGLLGEGLPTHKAVFTATAGERTLQQGKDELILELSQGMAGSGPSVHKTFRLRRGSYVIDVGFRVEDAPSSLKPAAYFQLVRDDTAPEGDSRWVPTYNGVAVYTEKEKYQKVQFSDIAKGKASHVKTANDGWIAMVQHYFVSAWLPKGSESREFFTRPLENGLYAAGVIVPAMSSAQGEWSVDVPLYVGPQEQKKLEVLAPGLQYTVDYGWLTVIATPLFWALSSIYKLFVQNWGVAIIVLTVIIKALFFPLSAASYKSMAKMRVLAPKLQKLKEQFGDDRQKLHQAMMEMYKTEKINPLGGCLPIVVQIPVFIALYWVLLGSVEMRHAPFALWIKDLSSPDPYYILPIIMGISMIVQTRLNPEPPDPIQAKVMKIMPVAFSIFFFFFPAGLVLYWVVNNVLSIAQQWYITRKLEKAGIAARKR